MTWLKSIDLVGKFPSPPTFKAYVNIRIYNTWHRFTGTSSCSKNIFWGCVISWTLAQPINCFLYILNICFLYILNIWFCGSFWSTNWLNGTWWINELIKGPLFHNYDFTLIMAYSHCIVKYFIKYWATSDTMINI